MRRRSSASGKGVQKGKRDPTIAWFVSPEKEVNQAMVEPLSLSVILATACYLLLLRGGTPSLTRRRDARATLSQARLDGRVF
jgi:hypothetical protein